MGTYVFCAVLCCLNSVEMKVVGQCFQVADHKLAADSTTDNKQGPAVASLLRDTQAHEVPTSTDTHGNRAPIKRSISLTGNTTFYVK